MASNGWHWLMLKDGSWWPTSFQVLKGNLGFWMGASFATGIMQVNKLERSTRVVVIPRISYHKVSWGGRIELVGVT